MLPEITLTEDAIQEVIKYMEADELTPDTSGLRVEVKPGGCSGFSYGLSIENKPVDDDIVLESPPIHVFVDPFSLQYLDGIVIDFVSGINGAGFKFINPNATGGCGCGTSFSV